KLSTYRVCAKPRDAVKRPASANPSVGRMRTVFIWLVESILGWGKSSGGGSPGCGIPHQAGALISTRSPARRPAETHRSLARRRVKDEKSRRAEGVHPISAIACARGN